MIKGAYISYDQKYRYDLWRMWDESKGYAMFVGLNPSTADAELDDPTIRRCITYAKDWGYGGLCMVNLFAYRATDPRVMKIQEDPVGPNNDATLKANARNAGVVVAAWGNHGKFWNRDFVVSNLLKDLHYLKLNADNSPAHPLYLKKDLIPVKWLR